MCSQIASQAPTNVAFDQIDLATGYACGLRSFDHQVQCWGIDSASVPVPTGVAFKQIAGAEGFAAGCGIRQDNDEVQCWGDIGAGVYNPPAGVKFDAIAGSGNDMCGVRSSDGAIVCWVGSLDAPPTGVSFTDVSVRGSEVCGLESVTGRLLCWGNSVINPVVK